MSGYGVPAHLAHRHHPRAASHHGGPTQGSPPSCRLGPHVPGYNEVVGRYQVNNPNQWEVIKQTIYDSVSYVAAGQTILTFFALPIGQGTGFGGGVKNESDTNLQMAANIPAMQGFLVQEVELIVQPTTPSVTAQLPAAFGAQAVAAIINDVYIIRRSGNLQFQIGSKLFLTEAPLSKFPSKTNFEVMGALSDATTPGAAFQSRIAFAAVKGPVYRLSPVDLFLEANQNFKVTLNWPEGVQAITNPARIFCVLGGLLYRMSQ